MYIQTNGIKIYTELSGKRGKPVVILSHCLASSLVMWDPQIEILSANYQVIRYDMRGHGKSEVPKGPYSLEMFGEDALGLLDTLGIDRVHWVGISMGGMVGQYVALNHPHRLSSLVLCDTASHVPPEVQPLWQERIDGAREKGMESQLQGTLERWFSPTFLHQNLPIVDIMRKQFLATSVEGYISSIEAIRRLNYINRLHEITLPTLIIVGEDDPGTPIASSEEMHKRIKDSKMVVIRSARHLSNIEQPEAFNATLLDFLKSI